MKVATGKSILNGIAIGKIRIYKVPERVINDSLIEDTDAELERFEAARVRVQDQQMVLYEKALVQAGEDAAGIFMFHYSLLDEDEDLYEAVNEIITSQKRSAEYAVKTALTTRQTCSQP